MWALKIRVREKWNIYNKRTLKFKVKLYFYSQNNYEEKGRIHFVASGIIEGEQQAKRRFLLDLEKDKKVKHVEWNNDFFVCIYSEKKTSQRAKAVKAAYNPRLIFLKPVVIDEDGWEEWEVASTRREDLQAFIKSAKVLPNIESKLFYLRRQKISNLMIYAMLPKLTERQRKAVILAIENGYYGYPRKVTLERLARAMKISTSTYQFHLAKAEAKMMPFLTKRY